MNSDKDTQTPAERSAKQPEHHRKKTLTALALLIIVLLLGYFYFREDKPDNTPTVSNSQTAGPEEVSSGIDSIISSFGIDSKWIRNAKPAKSTSLWFSKEVKLPVDLPLMNVNMDLTSYLSGKNLTVRSVEEPRSRNLKIEVMRSGDTSVSKIGLLVLSYSDSVTRAAADVCIILDSIEQMSLADAGSIMDSGEDYSVILPLQNDRADYQSLITERKRDHVIELHLGNEDAFESDFRNNMNEKELRSKVRSLSMSFPDASGVILKGAKQYAELGKMIQEEFRKFGFKVFDEGEFSRSFYAESKSENIFSVIRSFGSDGRNLAVVITSVNYKDFGELWMKLLPLRKRGYRFIDFGQLVKKKEKAQTRDSTLTGKESSSTQSKDKSK
jgi:hypothetical protein